MTTRTPRDPSIEVFNLLNIKPLRRSCSRSPPGWTRREASASFEFLVSLGVRLLISATIRSGSVETPLSTAAKDIFEGAVTTVAQLRDQLRPMTPSDALFTRGFRASASVQCEAWPVLPPLAPKRSEGRSRTVVHPAGRPGDHQPRTRPASEARGSWPQFTDDDVSQYAKRLATSSCSTPAPTRPQEARRSTTRRRCTRHRPTS